MKRTPLPRDDLHTLPPKARAVAMDKPFRPGHRAKLIGFAIVLAVFLPLALYMASRAGPERPRPVAPVVFEPTPGVVYQNLRAPVTPPPPHPPAPAQQP